MNQWDSAIVCLHNASEALSQVNVQNRLPAINVYINLADCYQHQGDMAGPVIITVKHCFFLIL